MFVSCQEAPLQDLYKILTGTIVPRPIAWVSTTSNEGRNNLAPFSFFNCFGADPPMVGFAPGFKSITRSGDTTVREPKDTLRNIEQTGQFVINIVSRKLAEQMNQSSASYEPNVSEFDRVGLRPANSTYVTPPRVSESLVSFECKLIQIIQHGNNNLVLGEILGIHLDDSVVGDRLHIRGDVLQAVGRLSGNWYTTTTDGCFELRRPEAAN